MEEKRTTKEFQLLKTKILLMKFQEKEILFFLTRDQFQMRLNK